ncbi:MAG TPA: aldose 1-epimerase [Chthonomonadaceae bacterium]|nr:aldose 1-epimerase [Chthonomonadaceae bacterium]
MSRYQTARRYEHGAEAFRLTDEARHAEAVVYPELGNNCVVFRTTPDSNGGERSGAALEPVDVFVPPDPIEGLRDVPFTGGLPILFPFPNRVRAGTYTFEGQTYHMDKLLAHGWDRGAGQAIHGLVADKAWTVEETLGDDTCAALRCSLQLDAFPDIREQYPFPCRLTVIYRLCEGSLEMHTEVVNTGGGNMPMGFGIHPWFPVALQPGATLPGALAAIPQERRARAEVRVPADAIWELEHLMPTGHILPVDTSPDELDLRGFRPLDGLFFDTIYTRARRGPDGWSESSLRDPQTGLELVQAADSGFREWVLYAPKDRPVIALEPYTCTTDAVNLQPRGVGAGLIVLGAGQTWQGDIRFGLRRS